MKTTLMEKFESETKQSSWINAEIYPDGTIYTKPYTEWLESLAAELKKENERLRPLIAKIKKSIVEDAIHWDPAKANELLQACEKALNGQPGTATSTEGQ